MILPCRNVKASLHLIVVFPGTVADSTCVAISRTLQFLNSIVAQLVLVHVKIQVCRNILAMDLGGGEE